MKRKGSPPSLKLRRTKQQTKNKKQETTNNKQETTNNEQKTTSQLLIHIPHI